MQVDLSFCRCAYAVRIFLRSIKIDKMVTKMVVESPFSQKKSTHKFSETDPSNHIISKFYTLWATFSLQNQKNTTYFTTLKTLLLYFKFGYISYELPLSGVGCIWKYIVNFWIQYFWKNWSVPMWYRKTLFS